MIFIPYISAVIILTIIGYFIHAVFKAGKTDSESEQKSNVLDVKKEQDKADGRVPLSPADIIARMRSEDL